MATKILPENIAAGLVVPGTDVAFLEYQGTFYFTRAPKVAALQPRSVVTDLIQGIYDRSPSNALLLLRQRIFSTAKPTEMCLGMVKIAAKSLTYLTADIGPQTSWGGQSGAGSSVGPIFVEIKFDAKSRLIEDLNSISSAAPMSSALKLAARTVTATELYLSDRSIAAVLTSVTGEVLAAAINSNGSNRTLHAEINLIQGYFAKTGRILPRGARLYTTLQPCKMCCGMIFHSCEDATSLHVHYAKKDPVAGRQKRAPLSEELTPAESPPGLSRT